MDTNETSPAATKDLNAALRAAIARIYSRFRSERAPDEMADAALMVLNHLLVQGPLGLGDLSAKARVTPGSMSQTVNRLVEGGYASRQNHPYDKRRVLLVLTERGTACIEDARHHRQEWLDGRLATLTEAERGLLADAANLLLKIADA